MSRPHPCGKNVFKKNFRWENDFAAEKLNEESSSIKGEYTPGQKGNNHRIAGGPFPMHRH